MRIRSVLVLLGLLVSAAVPAQGQTTVSVSSEPATGEVSRRIRRLPLEPQSDRHPARRSPKRTSAPPSISSRNSDWSSNGSDRSKPICVRRRSTSSASSTPRSATRTGLQPDARRHLQRPAVSAHVAGGHRAPLGRVPVRLRVRHHFSRPRVFGVLFDIKYHVEATLRQGGHRPRGIRARPRPHPLDRRHRACLCRAQYLDHCRVQWLQPAGEHQRAARAHYFDFDLYGSINFTHNFGAQLGYRSFDVFYLIDDEDEGELKLKDLFGAASPGSRRQSPTPRKPRIAAVGIDLRGRKPALVVNRSRVAPRWWLAAPRCGAPRLGRT